MRHTEAHGISSSNTVRRTKRYVNHHGKGVECAGGPRCLFIPPKNGGLCMTAGVKWGYSSRKNCSKFNHGFDGRKRDRCSFHGHRMCCSPILDDMTTHKKRENNKQMTSLNNQDDEYDPDYDNELEYGDFSTYMWDEEIPEEIDYREYYENDEFDAEVEDINYPEKEMDELDISYVEYEKMRNDEVDLDAAYAAYEKMKEDEWILVSDH